MLKAALATGTDVNARDSRGRTALMHAVDKGYLLLVSELLEAQADVNVRAPDGATALFTDKTAHQFFHRHPLMTRLSLEPRLVARLDATDGDDRTHCRILVNAKI